MIITWIIAIALLIAAFYPRGDPDDTTVTQVVNYMLETFESKAHLYSAQTLDLHIRDNPQLSKFLKAVKEYEKLKNDSLKRIA